METNNIQCTVIVFLRLQHKFSIYVQHIWLRLEICLVCISLIHENCSANLSLEWSMHSLHAPEIYSRIKISSNHWCQSKKYFFPSQKKKFLEVVYTWNLQHHFKEDSIGVTLTPYFFTIRVMRCWAIVGYVVFHTVFILYFQSINSCLLFFSKIYWYW